MSNGFLLNWNRLTGELASTVGRVARFDDLAVAFAGHLHDRSELAASCGLPANAENAALLAAAYRRWDVDFAARVDGEYVAAIIDLHRHRLIVGGDPIGLRQAYIHARPESVEVGSDIAMFSDHGLPLATEYFAHYLRTGHLTTALTPFGGVVRTVPGVVELFESSAHRSRQAWSLSELRVRPWTSQDEAAAHLRELLARAMRNVIESHDSVLIALSGGLDSSTVAAVAAHEGLTGLAAYTLVHPTTPEFDESAWAREIVERFGLPWHKIDVEQLLPFGDFPDELTGEPSISLLHQPQRQAIRRICAAAGSNTVLTGSGGDIVLGTYLGSYPTFLTDPLFAGAFGETWRQLRSWQRECVLQRSLLHWLRGGIVRPSLLHLRGKRQDTRPVLPPPDYMTSKALDRQKLAPVLPRCRSPWLQMIAELLQKSAMSIASSHGAGYAFDLRTPLLYRPLVEFLLTLPIDQLYRPSADRYLQRVALKGILPEKVRRRANKAGGSWSLIEGLRKSPAWQDFLCDRSMLAEMGLVDMEKWRQAVAMAKHGNTQGDMYFMATASAEAWLRMRSGSM